MEEFKIDRLYKRLHRSYISSAKSRGLSYELTLEEAIKLFKSNCQCCNLEPSMVYYYNQMKNLDEYIKYTGIDRIDNNLGYIPSNVRSFCKTCNRGKHIMTEIEFREWIKRIKSTTMV